MSLTPLSLYFELLLKILNTKEVGKPLFEKAFKLLWDISYEIMQQGLPVQQMAMRKWARECGLVWNPCTNKWMDENEIC